MTSNNLHFPYAICKSMHFPHPYLLPTHGAVSSFPPSLCLHLPIRLNRNMLISLERMHGIRWEIRPTRFD